MKEKKVLEVLVRRKVGSQITDGGGQEIPNLTYIVTKYSDNGESESIQQMAERLSPAEADTYLLNLAPLGIAIFGEDSKDLTLPVYEIIYFRREPFPNF